MTQAAAPPATAAKGSLRQASPATDEALREELAGLMAVLGMSRMVDHYAHNPQALSEQIFRQFIENPTVQRTVNQFAEQVVADADVVPEARNEVISQVVADYWKERRMTLQLPGLLKMFLISGEHWCLIPRTRRGFPMRFLTPWLVDSLKGYSAFDWLEANYQGKEGEQGRQLTPKDTAFFAHDALFDNLRGTPPFSALYFAVLRHKRYLDLRERVTRVAAMVTGEMNFATMEDAAAVLGWKEDGSGGYKTDVVRVPEDGTMVVTIGESKFELQTSGGNTQGADVDGKNFKAETTEASRLPEFFNGNGANVSVATAKVQYPIAMRALMALRDAFANALTQDLRLLLRRMADAGLIADQWTATAADGTTIAETPEDAVFIWPWPELSELNYNEMVDTVLKLYDRGLFTPEAVVKAAGWPEEEVMPEEIIIPGSAAQGDGDEENDDPPEDGDDEEQEGKKRPATTRKRRVTLTRQDIEAAVKKVLDEEIGVRLGL